MPGMRLEISNLKPNHFAWVCTHHRQDQMTRINTWRKVKITNPTIVANKKKTVALAHYIKATGRFTEAKQENNIKRANIWTKTHTA